MATQEIKDYYDATAHKVIRQDLEFAAAQAPAPKIAIDCGCGAGADVAFLLAQEFRVYAFDIEEESIARCRMRFQNNAKLFLSQNSFESFEYPDASLIVADASLFFCSKRDFDKVWLCIKRALFGGGIFCGSFLGPEDTMAGPGYDNAAWWPDVLVLHQDQVTEKLTDFEILRFTEHKTSGQSPQGTRHDWHLFSVVAKKI